MTIPAAFAAEPPAVRSEQSVIAVAGGAIAESVAPSGQLCRDRSGSAIAAGDAVPVSPWCSATDCTAKTFMPFCNALDRASSRGTVIRLSVRRIRQAPRCGGNPGLPAKRGRGSAGEGERGRCAAGAVRLALSSSAASKDAVLAPVSIGLTEAPIPPTD